MKTTEPIAAHLLAESKRARTLQNRSIYREAHALLRRAVRFDIRNVSEWIETMNLTLKDAWKMLAELDDCVPPWEEVHFEWDDQGVITGVIAKWYPGEAFVGVQYDVTDGVVLENGTWVARLDGTQIRRIETKKNGDFPDGILDIKIGLPDYLEKIKNRPDEWREIQGNVRAYSAEEAEELVMKALATGALISIFACHLMHCRNVETEDVDPRRSMSRQMIRAQERKGLPFEYYKRLVVRPISKSRKTRKDVESGPKKRMHLCRGHFVEYGPKYGKGLLFGRIEGRFFIPPHVRGAAEVGLVEKEYVLGKPRERATA